MAAIRANDGVLAFTSGNSVAVLDTRKPDAFHVINLPPGAESKAAKTKDKRGADGDGGGGGGGDGDVNRALASGFSGRGRFFALCDDLKRLHVFSTGCRPWTLLSSRLLARRATSLTFTLDEATVLVADKSGDLYSFPTVTQDNQSEARVKVEDGVKDEGSGVGGEGQVKEQGGGVKDEGEVKDGDEGKTEGRLVLGHLSMVLDVCLAQGDRLVVTCDRDEKVRVSRYPNGYHIHTYCLGHTQFVSCLLYVEEFGVLISGSGDATVRVWDMQGKQLCRASLPDKGKPSPAAVAAQQHRPPPPPPPPPSAPPSAPSPQAGEEEEEEGEGRRRAVRQLAYSKAQGLLMVTCHGESEVEVFHLRPGDEGPPATSTPTTFSLTHRQTLALPHPVWDLAWEERGATLWVLSPAEGATLSACRLRKREGCSGRLEGEKSGDDLQELYMVADTESDSETADTMRTVNAQWSFFAESLHVASELPGLWKTASQDNVLQYHQRKQQRLQADRHHHSHHRHHHHHHHQHCQRSRKGKKRAKTDGAATSPAPPEPEEASPTGTCAGKKARESS